MKKLIILFVLLFTLQVNATDWYVAKTGNDSNDGSSWQEAKLTISAMVTASSNGDTIYIGTGTYDEEVDLDTANKSITLDGVDKTASIARTGSGEKGIVIEDNTTIKNLTASSTSKTVGAMGISGNGKTNLVVEDCNIFGAYDGVRLDNCDGVSIKNSNISANYDGFNYSNSQNVVVEGCSFSTDGSYSTSITPRALMGNKGTIKAYNCSLTTTNDNSSEISVGFEHQGNTQTILNNCTITVSTGASNTGDVYGGYCLNANKQAIAIINSCTIQTSTTGSGTIYDLYNYSSIVGLIYIVDSSYNRSKVHGKIFEGSRQRRRYDLLDSSVR